MKLGEALTIRKKQATSLNDLRGRIKANALVQEGDTPQEDVETLLDDFEGLSLEHRSLVLRINKTNLTTIVEGDSLLELIASREDLIRQRTAYQTAIDAASPSRSDYRFSRQEIKFVPQIDVNALRADMENLSTLITNLDLTIQQANWQTDLTE